MPGTTSRPGSKVFTMAATGAICALAVGLDTETDTVLLNDPARKKLARYDREEFLESWAATDNWTLLAVPRSAN